MKIESMEKLFLEELKDIYDAEKRLAKALPKMAKAAKSEDLKAALKDHLAVTITQVGRLEQVFELIGAKATGKTCMAMKGLLEEGEEALATEGPEPIPDLVLVGAGRRVEHYEMAAYETLKGIAQTLELSEVEELLIANLQEEMDADEALSEIAITLLEGSSAGKKEIPMQKMPPTSNRVGTRKVVNG